MNYHEAIKQSKLERDMTIIYYFVVYLKFIRALNLTAFKMQREFLTSIFIEKF